MPALKIKGSPSRDAIIRVVEELNFIGYAIRNKPSDKQPSDAQVADYLLGLLWIEGFKVVPRQENE
jgi:hypothetical protein